MSATNPATNPAAIVARIHQSLTGRWYITDDSLPHLDERGPSYPSERAAIRAARETGEYTHRIRNGKAIRLIRQSQLQPTNRQTT